MVLVNSRGKMLTGQEVADTSNEAHRQPTQPSQSNLSLSTAISIGARIKTNLSRRLRILSFNYEH